MSQSKQDKRRKALERLQAESLDLLNQRSSLQCQSYTLIPPCDNEIRLAHEINILKVRLGMDQPIQESIF